MKTLIRIFLACLFLFISALIGAYFLVTNAGFQKRMLESRLPEGSSVRHVQVTTGSLELLELTLALADGTRVKVAEVKTSFSPLAAFFDNTIKLGAIDIDGLVVQLPRASASTPSSTQPVGNGGMPSAGSVTGPATGGASTNEPAANPWEAVGSIGNLDWLLDIERIALNGKIVDEHGITYVFDIRSGAIRPSAETVVDASLQLVSIEPLQSGLKEFDSNSTLRFTQKVNGGFEQVYLKSDTSGKDVAGRKVLAVGNEVDFAFNSFEEVADVKVSFDLDLQRPEMFIPELASMGALEVRGQAVGRVEGVVMTLSDANMVVIANRAEVFTIDLKKTLNLGGKQKLSGELLAIKIMEFPLAWLAPWLPEGMSLQGAPLSADMSISGLADGAMEVRAPSPLIVGPLTVRNAGQLLLQESTFHIEPVIRVNADQSITYELKSFKLLDRYGEVLSGQATGTSKLVEGSSNPFAGQKADVKLKLGLQELFQLPVLQDKASILGGTMTLELAVDGNAQYPLRVQGVMDGLRPRSMPGQTKDYRFASQLKAMNDEQWGVGVNFEAGPSGRPSTRLQISGQADPVSSPVSFKVDLTGEQILQSDIDLLVAAFSPNESTVSAPTPSAPPQPRSASTPTRPSPAVSGSVTPPWSNLNGQASVQLEQIILNSGQTIRDLGAKALVSRPLLQLSGMQAKLGEGTLNGSAEVRYKDLGANAYQLLADVGFRQIDPSIFAQKRSGGFPVKGLFDGDFKLSGLGSSLDLAVENSIADLTITGKEGVVTAFELDNRSQLGLGVIGILGQQFDRPGVAALTETVPYFKDIRFDNFTLKMNRGSDKRVMIPKLKFEGQSLLIDGSGFIAASSFKDVLDQPLQLGLELGARGRLTNYLETLQLLQPVVSEDGFRRWNKNVNIGGTLGKPNADEIMKLLKSAASSALQKPKAVATPTEQQSTNQLAQPQTQQPVATEQPREKTKAEKRREDIEMGLDLLNTVLGN